MTKSKPIQHQPHNANDWALLRIWQITGDSKKGIEPLMPIGRPTFLERVRKDIYPKPVKLGTKTSAWRKADILALLDSFLKCVILQ